MWTYFLKRISSGIITIWFICTATFFGMHAIPGDPLLKEKALPDNIRLALQQRYGLDRPLLEQYGRYLGNLLRGDFGISFTQEHRRVNDIIREHFPVSATLGLLALAYALAGALLWGTVAARCRDRWPDYLIMLAIVASISVPSFVFAALAQLLILKLNHWAGYSVLPVAGWGGIRHMLVPALVLGLATMAYLTRLMRASMQDVSSSDFIRTARAKGLPEWRIILRHEFPNAILPVISVLGPAIASITTGGFVVELVFSIPGLARYFIQAVQQLDYTVIMGTTVFYGTFLVVSVTAVDLLYGLIDPRTRINATRN